MFISKGVRKMVVMENLLYVLDTEVCLTVSHTNACVHTRSQRFHVYIWITLYFHLSQDVLSLWDPHFLVMTHCWPEIAIHDFEFTSECGSTSMAAYVSVSCTVWMLIYMKSAVLPLNNVECVNKCVLQPRQGKLEDDCIDKARRPGNYIPSLSKKV